MPIALAPLPYSLDALEPVISAETLAIHHGRHHRGYVDRLNAAIRGSDLEAASLEDIVHRSARGRTTASRLAIFQSAAQAWNHQFFWESLRPPGGAGPGPELARRIARDFRSHAAFAMALKAAATNHFGSGWAWLTIDARKLRITTTMNADTPLAHGRSALLAIDVWEHSYYLDHHNRRADYVAGVVDRLLDWDFAERNLHRAEAEHPAQPVSREIAHAW